ncbi:MAG: amidohydrolase family protein [Bacilli bacterium]|jgi:imidazolonepropionase-like amidohydrolase|nr:amidohydrolase family protein [Bacilli bacterium]
MKEAFIGGYLIDGTKEAKTIKADILVEDGKIIKIGKFDLDGVEVIDCLGKFILPGLINMHAHLFGSGKPSKNLGAKSKSQEILVSFVNSKMGRPVIDKLVAKHVETELLSGVTSLRSVGDFNCSDLRIRDKVNRGKLIGPHMYCSGAAITVPSGHGDGTFAQSASTPEGLKALVDQRKEQGVDWIKICVTGGVMDAKRKGAPGEVKMSLEQTKAVCDEAHKLGYRVASHTESPDGMRIAIEGGVDTLEHSADFSLEDQKILKERNGALILTFSPAIPLSMLPPEVTKLNEMCIFNSNVIMTNMIKGGQEAEQAGIRVGLGTDASCPFCAQYGMWREVWYYAKMMKKTPAEAIHHATLVNAEILGVEKITGSLEEGKAADLLIVAHNPLNDLNALSEPYLVVKDGTIYKKKPEHNKFIDEQLKALQEKLLSA